LIVDEFKKNEDVMWVATGFGHLFESQSAIGNFMIPKYHDNIHRGGNTFGCPSVISIRKTDPLLLFDESLAWLMDCEYYKRLHKKFGDPSILEFPGVIIRVHDNSVSANYNEKDDEKEKELEYVVTKIEEKRTLH